MIERGFDPNCIFCQIVAGDAPATVMADGISNLAIVPLNPVVDGHFLVIPKTHVPNAYADPGVTATAMHDATLWASLRADRDSRFASANIITSVGRPATQSVWHLHIHVVPRVYDDGLKLPWTDQVEAR